MTGRSSKPIAFADWPVLDRDAWLRGTTPAGLFDRGCHGARWSSSTKDKYRRGYGHWLAHLLSAGALDPNQVPGDRVAEHLVVSYFEALRARGLADYTLVGRLEELSQTLMILDPARDWRWITCPYGRPIRRQLPMRRKERVILPIRRLFHCGVRLMDTASSRRGASRQLCQFRDGLIFALLAACPFRRRNISEIEIGQNLVRCGDRYLICFPKSETKTGRPEEKPVPPFLTGYVETYLGCVRPRLLQGRSETAMWINWNGLAMSARSVQSRLDWIGDRQLGGRIGFNMFRYAAATDISIFAPEQVHIIAPVLNHTNLRTGERHYNRANAVIAANRYHQDLRLLRKAGRITRVKHSTR